MRIFNYVPKNYPLDPTWPKSNFISSVRTVSFSKTYTSTNLLALGPPRMTVLLLVCLTQSWLLWKFIRFQLRRWREFRHEQAVRKKAAPKQPLRTLKRDSREYKHPVQRVS